MSNAMSAMSREEREELRLTLRKDLADQNNGITLSAPKEKEPVSMTQEFVVVIENKPPFSSGVNARLEKKRYCVVGGFKTRDEAWEWGNEVINNRTGWAVIEQITPERGLDLDLK